MQLQPQAQPPPLPQPHLLPAALLQLGPGLGLARLHFQQRAAVQL